MTRILLAVFVVVCLAVAAAPAAGQQANTSNGSTTPDVETVAVQIDDTTTLRDYEYRNGTWRLTVATEVPSQLVITDSARAMQAWADADGKTATSLEPRRYTLGTGETIIEYDGDTFDGQAAITISTGSGTYFLATDGIETARQPVPWTTVQGLIGFTGLAAVSGTFYWVKRKYESQDEEIERIT